MSSRGVCFSARLCCCRGLLSARSLLGAIDRAEDRLSPRLVAVYLLNRIKRFC